jgi:hypothetical protein
MNTETKSKWLSDLRSGEFTQGYGLLRQTTSERGDLWCCLGVLCSNLDGVWVLESDGAYVFNNSTASSACILPYSEIISLKHATHLMNMNDSGRCSFEEIADWIDNNIEDKAP